MQQRKKSAEDFLGEEERRRTKAVLLLFDMPLYRNQQNMFHAVKYVKCVLRLGSVLLLADILHLMDREYEDSSI